MVTLDGRRSAEAGFDDVGVDRALCEVVDRAYLLALFLKNTNELLAYYLALALGLGNARKLCKEPVGGVDTDKIDVPL